MPRIRTAVAAALSTVLLVPLLLAVTATPALAADPIVSQGKTATARSQESSAYAPRFAVDGSGASRWASAETNSEWIQIDLGQVYLATRVVLTWEAAYATGYKIQMSDNASTWWDAYTTTTGNGGTDDLTVAQSGRYIRMLGTQRATVWGYSLWEFQVYGKESPHGGTGGNWFPLYADEFSGSSLDTTKWQPNWFGANDTVTTGPVNSFEQQCYAPSQVTVSSGSLHLALVKTATTCAGSSHPYKSGLIHSSGRNVFGTTSSSNNTCRGGCYFEARIKLPALSTGVKNWPAWWTDGDNVAWPAGGEGDIMEGLGGNLETHFHYGTSGVDTYNQSGTPASQTPFRDQGWHTYGAQWSNDRTYRVYFDGTLIKNYTGVPVSAGHFLILNYATCSGCTPQAAGTMDVDYVRVWGR